MDAAMGEHGEHYNTRQQSRLRKVSKYHLSRNKVIVVGDSHARGCAEELIPLLRQNFQVTGNVKSGANTRKRVRSPNEESRNATRKDYIVLWTGSNGVSKNNTNEGLKGIEEYVKQYKYNIIVMGIPHRYDLSPTSCVNFEVQKFNRKLKKQMKLHPHVTILDISLDRKYFITHSLHMNATGKHKIAQIIAIQIEDLTAKTKDETVITMPWKLELQSRYRSEEDTNGNTTNESEETTLYHNGGTPPKDSFLVQTETPAAQCGD
jgi:hypothetical protein